MIKNGGGRIVQFSSSTAFSGSAFAGPAYATSKAAVLDLHNMLPGIGQKKYSCKLNLSWADKILLLLI